MTSIDRFALNGLFILTLLAVFSFYLWLVFRESRERRMDSEALHQVTKECQSIIHSKLSSDESVADRVAKLKVCLQRGDVIARRLRKKDSIPISVAEFEIYRAVAKHYIKVFEGLRFKEEPRIGDE